ncbi:hypothetical protein E3N88_20734 [Mikania micrantha]|uniref:Uncharacterized protein n=1 Tax=Mikania micrantha TaxID=192012 RepID=A0A5N6NHV9_9ASTR|nr:hypothetical protein E3N88_20734 [Mikania micrantha]
MDDKVSPSATVTVTLPETCYEMTGDDMLVNDHVEQEESSIMKEESSKWTNEKHSLYLKSIEASFVDQLYNSLGMQACQRQSICTCDAISTWRNHPNICIPSGQFKILQCGCWSKKCFNREKSQLKDALSLDNPWILHFTNGSRKRLSSTSSSLQYHVSDSQLHQDTGRSNTEVTDQNFVEDASCSGKRTRTSKIAHSSNDQVVPNCISDAPLKSLILMVEAAVDELCLGLT